MGCTLLLEGDEARPSDMGKLAEWLRRTDDLPRDFLIDVRSRAPAPGEMGAVADLVVSIPTGATSVVLAAIAAYVRASRRRLKLRVKNKDTGRDVTLDVTWHGKPPPEVSALVESLRET
jgi:hypothetical protein